MATDIDTFNPFLAILASSTGILRFQYENLVQYGVNNEPVPGLADKWETSHATARPGRSTSATA